MRGAFTFNKTVIGHKHILKNLPCEDFSLSFSDKYGMFDIAIVADGHGDPSCFRSSKGSQFATSVAKDCLIEFALLWGERIGELKELLESQRNRTLVIKNLTDAILHRWHELLREDLESQPITEEEYLAAGTTADLYRAGKNLEHIYGTTLIAALRVFDLLFLIQQGDGRCEVIYADGSADQPIPWDDRCVENVTTSMCDEDAVISFRHCVLDIRKNNVVAVYLGSDGIEDSYRNMEGTHLFYKQLSCDLISWSEDEIDAMLEERLSTLSREGSADDMSVAGIVAQNSIKLLVEQFRCDIKNYNKSEEKEFLESKLFSMERKLAILKKKHEESLDIYSQKQEKVANLQIKIDEVRRLLQKQDEELLENEAKNEEPSLAQKALEWLDKVKEFAIGEAAKRDRLEREEKALSEALESAAEELREYFPKYENDKLEYEKYNSTYFEIKSKILELSEGV